MIVKKEKIYKKKNIIHYDVIKCTGWWLFGFIPLFLNYQIIGRE